MGFGMVLGLGNRDRVSGLAHIYSPNLLKLKLRPWGEFGEKKPNAQQRLFRNRQFGPLCNIMRGCVPR